MLIELRFSRISVFFITFQTQCATFITISFPASHFVRYVVAYELEQTIEDNTHLRRIYQVLHDKRKKAATQSCMAKDTKVKSHWRTFTIQPDNAPFTKHTQFIEHTVAQHKSKTIMILLVHACILSVKQQSGDLHTKSSFLLFTHSPSLSPSLALSLNYIFNQIHR